MTDVTRMVAELEIRNLVARYCHAYDQGRVDDYCELFVEDASFHAPPLVAAEGRDQIREQVAAGAATAPPAQHVTYNTVVDVGDDGRATGRSDFMYVRAGREAAIQVIGRYLDEFVLRDGAWRFQRRTVEFAGE